MYMCDECVYQCPMDVGAQGLVHALKPGPAEIDKWALQPCACVEWTLSASPFDTDTQKKVAVLFVYGTERFISFQAPCALENVRTWLLLNIPSEKEE